MSLTLDGSLGVFANNVTANVSFSTGQQTLFSNATTSTSTTTGAVIVTGGVGISGNVNSGGNVIANAFIDNIDLGNQANSAYLQANNAASFANSSFTKANNALANTSGTFAGSLYVTGGANVASSVGIGTTPYGQLDVNGTINGYLPGWTWWIDTTSNSRTTLGAFTKSVQGFMVSQGDIYVTYHASAWSMLFQMKVYSPGTVTVTQMTLVVDDNDYFFISGGTGSSTVTASSGAFPVTAPGTIITWTLTQGINTISVLHNNSGGSGAYVGLIGDFFVQHPTLKYVYP